LEAIEQFFSASVASGQFSNFGPCARLAKAILDSRADRHHITCANGTDAITLALLATLPRGARVGVPDFTCAPTLNAVVRAHMTPVIIPSSAQTLAMDLFTAERAIDCGRVDALVVVAPFGFALDSESFENLARRKGTPLVYDCAGAWPQLPRTRFPVTYSLHATKNLTTLEGGLVSFANEEDCERARRLSNFAYDADRICLDERGFNSKLDEWRAATLCAHLENLAPVYARIQRRKETYARYASALPVLSAFPQATLSNAAPSLLAFGHPTPQLLVAHARTEDVPVMRYYWPLLSSMPLTVPTVRPHSPHDRAILERVVALPGDPTEEEFERVVAAVRGVGT
jgi:dTDP-4-amino-4,6-dideoxygalactose transaminase